MLDGDYMQMQLRDKFARMLHSMLSEQLRDIRLNQPELHWTVADTCNRHLVEFELLSPDVRDWYIIKASDFTAAVNEVNKGLSIEAVLADRDTVHFLYQEMQKQFEQMHEEHIRDIQGLRASNTKLQEQLNETSRDLKALFAGTLTQQDVERRTK